MPASGVPAADQTRQIPPVEDEGAWSGRAPVRGPRPATESTSIGGYAPVAEPEPQRKWWLPILLGALALVVVAALIWAGWLITRPSGSDAPAPVASSAPVPSSVAPTSASPSRSASPSPTAEPAAAKIPVPPVVGLNQGDAVRMLDDLGLSYRVSFTAGEGPLGTVLSSNPKEGVEVKPGTEIKLVVVDRLVTPTPSPSTSDQLPVEE
jgi:hypothetical protein